MAGERNGCWRVQEGGSDQFVDPWPGRPVSRCRRDWRNRPRRSCGALDRMAERIARPSDKLTRRRLRWAHLQPAHRSRAIRLRHHCLQTRASPCLAGRVETMRARTCSGRSWFRGGGAASTPGATSKGVPPSRNRSAISTPDQVHDQVRGRLSPQGSLKGEVGGALTTSAKRLKPRLPPPPCFAPNSALAEFGNIELPKSGVPDLGVPLPRFAGEEPGGVGTPLSRLCPPYVGP